MSRAFYKHLKDNIADKLIPKYGHAMDIVDSDKNVLETVQGLKSPVRIENTPQNVIERSNATVYITATESHVPTESDYLYMDGEYWTIIWVEPVRPTDFTIMYSLFVSNGG